MLKIPLLPANNSKKIINETKTYCSCFLEGEAKNIWLCTRKIQKILVKSLGNPVISAHLETLKTWFHLCENSMLFGWLFKNVLGPKGKKRTQLIQLLIQQLIEYSKSGEPHSPLISPRRLHYSSFFVHSNFFFGTEYLIPDISTWYLTQC